MLILISIRCGHCGGSAAGLLLPAPYQAKRRCNGLCCERGPSMEDWDRLVETWTATLKAVDRLGGHTNLASAKRAGITHSKIWGLNILPPAQAADIQSVEAQLGISLPAALAQVFLQCASSIDFLWQLPHDFPLPEAFRGIFSGGLSLSLGSLRDHELSRREWVQTCFPDPDSPYDAVWHNKLAVIEV